MTGRRSCLRASCAVRFSGTNPPCSERARTAAPGWGARSFSDIGWILHPCQLHRRISPRQHVTPETASPGVRSSLHNCSGLRRCVRRRPQVAALFPFRKRHIIPRRPCATTMSSIFAAAPSAGVGPADKPSGQCTDWRWRRDLHGVRCQQTCDIPAVSSDNRSGGIAVPGCNIRGFEAWAVPHWMIGCIRPCSQCAYISTGWHHDRTNFITVCHVERWKTPARSLATKFREPRPERPTPRLRMIWAHRDDLLDRRPGRPPLCVRAQWHQETS